MSNAAVVTSILLALIVIVSAEGKLRHRARQVQVLQRVGFPLDRMWLLAAAELAGAGGLLVGLAWWPLGAAAAAGLVLYFLGAVAAHLRVRDRDVAAGVILLLLSAATLVLLVLAR